VNVIVGSSAGNWWEVLNEFTTKGKGKYIRWSMEGKINGIKPVF